MRCMFHLFLFKAIALRIGITDGSISAVSDSPPGTKTRMATTAFTVLSTGMVPGGLSPVSTVTSMEDTYMEGRLLNGRASSGTRGWVRPILWNVQKWRSDQITKFLVWSLHSASWYKTLTLLTQLSRCSQIIQIFRLFKQVKLNNTLSTLLVKQIQPNNTVFQLFKQVKPNNTVDYAVV